MEYTLTKVLHRLVDGAKKERTPQTIGTINADNTRSTLQGAHARPEANCPVVSTICGRSKRRSAAAHRFAQGDLLLIRLQTHKKKSCDIESNY